jgi:hypothetical protein
MTTTTDKVTCRTAAYVAIFLVSLSTLHSASAWRNDRRKFSFDFIFIFFSRTCVSLLRLTFSSRCENPLVPLSWFIPPLPPTRLVPLGSRFTNYTIFFNISFLFLFFRPAKKKTTLLFARVSLHQQFTYLVIIYISTVCPSVWPLCLCIETCVSSSSSSSGSQKVSKDATYYTRVQVWKYR